MNSTIYLPHANHLILLNENGEYSFSNSDVYNSKRGALAWGLWHDPELRKTGMTKNKAYALDGYRRFQVILVSTPFTQNELKKSWYGIKVNVLETYVINRIDSLEAL